jgi:hypothetical protein
MHSEHGRVRRRLAAAICALGLAIWFEGAGAQQEARFYSGRLRR